MSSVLKDLKHRTKAVWESFSLGAHMKHVHGPCRVQLREDEFTVVCLIRDGVFFVREFVAHHRALGAKHFVFIDNGSVDGTVDELRKYDQDVTVLQCLLSTRVMQSEMRRYAARRFAANGWALIVDCDEHFLNPAGDGAEMGTLLRYLNEHGYTCVVAQMLDLYQGDFGNGVVPSISEALDGHALHFEVGSINQVDYHDRKKIAFEYWLRDNVIDSSVVHFCFGGVRKRVFGTNNCLTKHALVRVKGPVVPSTHPHCSSHVVCADFTAAILHFKMVGDFYGRARRDLIEARYAHTETEAYVQAADGLGCNYVLPGMSQCYEQGIDLFEVGLLRASARFHAELGAR